MASYVASSICRIDWRPSRLLVSSLIALALLAPWSIALSSLPAALSWPSGLAAMAWGLWLARREAGRPHWRLSWAGGDDPAWLSGPAGERVLKNVQVRLRRPMASLTGLDDSGRRWRLVWWPDTLPAAARRQLRFASQVSRRSGKPLRQLAA